VLYLLTDDLKNFVVVFSVAMSKVDEETLEEWKEVFQQFDANNDGQLTLAELRLAMLDLGKDLTQSELQSMCGGGASIAWPQFQSQLTTRTSHKANQAELVQALRVLSKTGASHVDVSELRFNMTNLGEKLDDDEINLMVLEADPNDTGVIDANTLASIMTAE